MTVRLGGSTFSFMWREPALESMRRMGDIALNDFDVLLAPGHLWLDLDAQGRRDLRATLEREGLRLDSVNLPALDLNLASPLSDVRDYAVVTYYRAIELAADLNARAVVVVPGRVSTLLPPPREPTIAGLTDAMGALAARAFTLERELFVELHPQTPLPRTDQLAAWVSALGSSNVSIAYDVANAVFYGEDPAGAIARHGALIGQYHLSDTTPAAWRHDPLGKGSVPFREILAAIDTCGFGGTAVLEIVSEEPICHMKEAIEAINPEHRQAII